MAANNIEKLLGISVAPAQDLENALRQLELYRFVDTAEGVQLDTIGSIVGQDRGGLSDADYRRYIRARVAANKSRGVQEDLLTVAFLVVYDGTVTYTLKNEGTATARLTIGGGAITDSVAAILYEFVSAAVAAGVRIVVEWSTYTPASTFTLDTGPGLDVGHLANALG